MRTVIMEDGSQVNFNDFQYSLYNESKRLLKESLRKRSYMMAERCLKLIKILEEEVFEFWSRRCFGEEKIAELIDISVNNEFPEWSVLAEGKVKCRFGSQVVITEKSVRFSSEGLNKLHIYNIKDKDDYGDTLIDQVEYRDLMNVLKGIMEPNQMFSRTNNGFLKARLCNWMT